MHLDLEEAQMSVAFRDVNGESLGLDNLIICMCLYLLSVLCSPVTAKTVASVCITNNTLRRASPVEQAVFEQTWQAFFMSGPSLLVVWPSRRQVHVSPIAITSNEFKHLADFFEMRHNNEDIGMCAGVLF